MATQLTHIQRKKYLTSGYGGCPNCGDSEHIESNGSFEADGNQAWRSFECTACGTTFEDIYTLTDVEIK